MREPDNIDDLDLFTFITEIEGSTIIEQVRGKHISDAVDRWCQISQIRKRKTPEYVVEATPVSETTNVWCLSGHVGRSFYISHIVATSAGRFG